MQIGELRERVTIQKQELVPNGSGGTMGAWSDLATTWAKVTRQEGSRTEQSGQLLFNRPYVVAMRHRIDFNVMERLKIVHRGVDIILHSVMDEDFRQRLYTYQGYADAKGPNTAQSDTIQLYQDGSIQLYQNDDVQLYEG